MTRKKQKIMSQQHIIQVAYILALKHSYTLIQNSIARPNKHIQKLKTQTIPAQQIQVCLSIRCQIAYPNAKQDL